jgi:hypothetical protein
MGHGRAKDGKDQPMTEQVMWGVGRLRDRRGSETFTGEELAERLTDHARRHPEDADVADRIAAVLAEAEGPIERDTTAAPGTGL